MSFLLGEGWNIPESVTEVTEPKYLYLFSQLPFKALCSLLSANEIPEARKDLFTMPKPKYLGPAFQVVHV